MNLPEKYTTHKNLLYELIGAGVVLILLIITLSRAYISFHWVTDTLWLAATLFLILPELTKNNQQIKLPRWMKDDSTALICCLYLFLYHFFICLFSLRYINIHFLLYTGAAVLFGMALLIRAKDAGMNVRQFNWKNLLHYPHWPLTIGLSLCLLALFFPMTKIQSLRSYYGLQFNYNAYSGWGYNNWGYNFYNVNMLIKGHRAYWGHFACLLFSFMLIFHIIKAAANKPLPKTDMFYKIAVLAGIAWWFFGAKGYDAVKGFGNILFIPAMLLIVMAVYLPEKLGELVKRKNLIN